MPRWKKNVFIIAIIILAFLVFRYYTNPERKITRFIENNEEQLILLSTEYLNGKIPFFGEKDEFKGVEIEGLFEGEYPIVQFFDFGVGLVPSSKYYGFYYSPEDQPASHWNEGYPLRETKEDTWEWTGLGDNGGITKKIKTNWYYYEAWY